MLAVSSLIGSHDVLLMTLDTLRYDVAVDALARGATPNLARLLPSGWERRHTPGNFTYAAHQAFFAGFLPTPSRAARQPRTPPAYSTRRTSSPDCQSAATIPSASAASGSSIGRAPWEWFCPDCSRRAIGARSWA